MTTASQITANLNIWNAKQTMRQSNFSRYRGVLKSALKRSMSDDLENTRVWSKALFLK